jgi:hypothetical protein
MGLDIYFHKTTIPFEGNETNPDDFRAFTDKVDELAKTTLRSKIDKLLEPLEEAWNKLQTNDYWRKIYNERYFAFVEKLRPLIATNYDFKIHPYTEKILDLPDLKARLDKEVEMSYEEYNAYFRKVNFLFYYFDRTLGKMYDQCYAFVELDDVDDLIDRCEQVLKDHKLAHSLLPTQDGFFFGSTDYDDWYFSDVKDCLKQMKKYRKLLKDGVTGYVIFSW